MSIDIHQIYDDCITLSEDVMSRAKREARGKGWIVVSRGFEFLSLDENGERDENIIDYVEDEKLTAEVIQEFIDDVRKQGSAFLAIGWGVDQADDQEGYDCGDYSPMFDWDDLPDIDCRVSKVTCGNCGRSWDERQDPAPSALCHWCHGRGHSTAPLD